MMYNPQLDTFLCVVYFAFLKRNGLAIKELGLEKYQLLLPIPQNEINMRHQLLVSGKDVRKIKLYHAGGNLLRQASGTDGKTGLTTVFGMRTGGSP